MSETAVRSDVKPEVVYRSVVQVEAKSGGIKMIHLPSEKEPVPMGMHGPIAAHYKIPEGKYTPHASTLDYVVGATAGCLMGTLNRALQVRKIATDGDRLKAEAVGELEVEDGVLVIRRILMKVRLQAEESQRETAERTIEVYATGCPVYRSLYKAIDITTRLDFQPL
jgi:organic hydroperoxide reductase OsmC/OhrA